MVSSRPGYRVLVLLELLCGLRNIKGLRNTNMNVQLSVGQPLDERCPAQSVRQPARPKRDNPAFWWRHRKLCWAVASWIQKADGYGARYG